MQNVIEEMAVAAGPKPPRVVLLESDAANAALVGSSDADATVVVSRRLLDDFSRDETQAIAGHLVGSMNNGDLQIAFTMASALASFGLLIALLDAPFGPRHGNACAVSCTSCCTGKTRCCSAEFDPSSL